MLLWYIKPFSTFHLFDVTFPTHYLGITGVRTPQEFGIRMKRTFKLTPPNYDLEAAKRNEDHDEKALYENFSQLFRNNEPIITDKIIGGCKDDGDGK